MLDDLEATLITADLGVNTTTEILARLKEQMKRRKLPGREAIAPRRGAGDSGHSGKSGAGPARTRARPKQPPARHAGSHLCGGRQRRGQDHQHRQAGEFLSCSRTASPLLCAADTFRAAANEQLEIWAGRLGIEMIKQKSGRRPCGGAV